MLSELIEKINNGIFGEYGGMKYSDLDKLTRRSRFSDFLPYLAYNPETGEYLNSDDTIGFAWECSPMFWAGTKTLDVLEGLLKSLPENTLMQFILYADEHIDPYINAYKQLTRDQSSLVQKTTDAFCDFLRNKKVSVDDVNSIPLKNFRSFVTVKFPISSYKDKNLAETTSTIRETLYGGLLYPYEFNAVALTEFLRRFFNGKAPEFGNAGVYSEDIPIRRQVINSETEIEFTNEDVKMGRYYWKCLTPKSFPPEVDSNQTNNVFGGTQGFVSDMTQYKTPFLYCLNIATHDLSALLHTKCNFQLRQESIGSWAGAQNDRKQEYESATRSLDRGERFLRILPMLWVRGDSKQHLNDVSARAKVIWEKNGYAMQEDRGILQVLLISSLPFGLYDKKGNIAALNRDFFASADTVKHILPIQADFAGCGDPVTITVGRKGQLCGFDLFDKNSPNKNFLIVGTTGTGKSVLANHLLYREYSAGCLVRGMDIGASYLKLCKALKGRFISFEENSKVCLNPFSNLSVDNNEDFNGEMSFISAIVMQMAYSFTNQAPLDTAELASSLIKSACRWAWQEYGADTVIDNLCEYLSNFPDFDKEIADTATSKNIEKLKELAFSVAFNLREFTSKGIYGKWFCGKANVNIASDRFVFLDVEHLKAQKELFTVVTMQLMNEITRDLYLSKDSERRLMPFDEAHLYIKESKMMADAIEEGFRRARKYDGSIGILTQSVRDKKLFGSVGDVIWGNSAYKFYLQSDDFETARHEKLLDYDDFTLNMLKDIRSKLPHYSEIFVDTPRNKGITRLFLDKFSYYLYVTKGKEFDEIEHMVNKGLSYEEAIDAMVAKYHN